MTGIAAVATRRDTIGPVPTPDDLARQAEAVRNVGIARLRRERAHQSADEADEAWRQAILDAFEAGAMVRDIVEASGVSRQYIYDITHGKA